MVVCPGGATGTRAALRWLWEQSRGGSSPLPGTSAEKTRFYLVFSALVLVFSRYDSLALYRLMYHTADAADLCLPRKREKLERAITVLGLDMKRPVFIA